jgi:hypothetical protein
MNEIDKAGVMVSLIGETCELNHGSWVCDDTQAVDILVIPMGYKESPVGETVIRELIFYLCEDCAKTLQGNDKDWILLVCTSCGSTAWKLRSLLKQTYSSDILQLMEYCPNCYYTNYTKRIN